MNKNKYIVYFLTFFCFFLLPYRALAEELENTFDVTLNTIGYENVGYLDLEVEKDKKIPITVTINNLSNKKQTFVVSPENGYTNSNGLIDYKKDNEDNRIPLAFTELIEKEKKVNIEGKKKEKVEFTLEIPKEVPKGMILGAFVTDIDSSDTHKGKNMSMTQRINFLNVVKIRTTKEKIIPELMLKKVNQNKENNLLIEIENPDAVMFGEFTIDYELVRLKDNKKILKNNQKNLEMAPNSVYPLLIDLNPYRQEIKKGTYQFKMKGTSGVKTWNLKEEVELSPFKEKNRESNQEGKKKSPENNKIILYLIIIILILLTLLIILIIKYKKKYSRQIIKEQGKGKTKNTKRKKKKRKKN